MKMINKNLLHKVLLVDDEPFIRKGLSALIDWEAEGYQIAGEAQNGYEAIEMLKKDDYQLIISDIKMPDMDGIEFAQYVKDEKLSYAKFVFLSGYYDFSYAKSAIQCGCTDYVLKPIQKEELLSILRRIQNELKETGGVQDSRIREKAYLDRNLLALIWGKYDDINVNCVKRKLKISDNVAYIHVEISLLDSEFSLLSEEKKREYQRKLYTYASFLLKKYADYIILGVTKMEECYDIGIVYTPLMGKEKGLNDEEWLEWILKELKERIGFDIVACTGNLVKEIEDITISYKEAMLTRTFRFFHKKAKTTNMGIKKSPVKHIQEEYFRKELDGLIHAIELGDKTYIKENAGNLYRRMMDKCIDSELIGLNIQYYLYRLLGLAYEIETDINQEEIMRYIQEAAFSTGIPWSNDMKFQKFAQDYSDYLVQLRKESTSGIIMQIEAEIEANYAESISLKSLGEKYFINSAYLGQIFKKQYGCSFKDYLNGVRIRKAAEMLLRTTDKVYVIAEAVGYKNMEYFIHKFESIYGMTPARFRKRNCNAINE